MDWKRLDLADQNGAAAFAARQKRVRNAVELRQPGRLPFYLSRRFGPARLAGMTYARAMHDTPAYVEAVGTYGA